MRELEGSSPRPRKSGSSTRHSSTRGQLAHASQKRPSARPRRTTAENRQTKSLAGVASYIVALGQTDPFEQAVWKRALAGRPPYSQRGTSAASYTIALSQTDRSEQATWTHALGARTAGFGPQRRREPRIDARREKGKREQL